ncbi:restriction endonuclease subunit S [Owenweeksia hongkongensis]|uniref:restriction endonuclease subunit S n=1 Tax=Owenweeksia hongkongensis TaxID=253245 RepID=UPI003A8CDCD3
MKREGWKQFKFEDITISLKRGPFGGDLKKSFFVESGYRVYEQQHAINNDFTLGRYFIDEERFQKLKACAVGPGDYIVSCSGTMGRIARLPENAPIGVINQALLRIRINEDLINPKYFIDFFRSKIFQNEILRDSRGSGMQNMAGIKEIKPILIELPPLPEQRVIVAKIEQLFSELDNGIANLKAAQEQLKVYRLSVLSAVMSSKNIVPLSDIIEDLSQGWSPKCLNKASEDKDEWAVIKTTAVQPGKYVEAENKILPDSLEPRIQHEIQSGDILITRAGPRVRVGICCLVKATRPKLINCDKVYRIKPNKNRIVPEFLEYSLNSAEQLRKIERMKTGSSDSGLNLTQSRFVKLKIPLPSLKEQNQTVQEIESRFSVCDKIEESITESLIKAEALRQSILKKAFAGELLSEKELKACRKEPDWEPAENLLERLMKT